MKKFIRYKTILGGIIIEVPNVEVHMYRIQQDDGTFKWEETFPCKSWRRIELAIERKLPNWFHKIGPNGEHNPKTCPSCKNYRKK